MAQVIASQLRGSKVLGRKQAACRPSWHPAGVRCPTDRTWCCPSCTPRKGLESSRSTESPPTKLTSYD